MKYLLTEIWKLCLLDMSTVVENATARSTIELKIPQLHYVMIPKG